MEDRTVIDPQFQMPPQQPGGAGEATQILTPGMTAPAAPAYEDRTQQAIVTTCPVCGTPNGPAERYCQDCGLLMGSVSGDVEALPDLATLPRLTETATGREFPLNPGANSVGRDSADLLIADSTVSRRHATLTLEGDTLTVEDLGSSNGTYVGSRRLAPGERAAVMSGDTLKFGAIVLTATLPGGEGRPGAAVPAAPVRGEVTAQFPARGEVTAQLPAALHVPVESGPAVAALVLGDGTELPLAAGVNSVGRRSGNDVVISDAFMSGKHGEITVNPDGTAQFVDVGSTNGSYVDGQRLAPHSPIPLVEGTVFTLGKTQVTYRASAPAGAGAGSSADGGASDADFQTMPRGGAEPPPAPPI